MNVDESTVTSNENESPVPTINHIIEFLQQSDFKTLFNFLYKSPFCGFFLQLLAKYGLGIDSELKSKLLSYYQEFTNFDIPFDLSPQTTLLEQKMEIRANDVLYQQVFKLFDQRGNPFRIDDFCTLNAPVQLPHSEEDQFTPIISPAESLRIARYLDVNPGIVPSDVFSLIANAPEGVATQQHENGYVKINYEQSGLPKCSGAREKDIGIINNEWKVLEKPCSNMPNQVSDAMEIIEDDTNEIDVNLTRCKNVLKLLLINPGLALSTQSVATELQYIYSEDYGPIMTEFLINSGDATYHNIVNKVRERCISLIQQKLKIMLKYSTDLSHELPIQQSKYQELGKLSFTSTDFSTVGKDPIKYAITDTKFLQMIQDQYWKLRVSDMHITDEEVEACKETFKTIINQFRKEKDVTYSATFEEASLYSSAAYLLSEISKYNISSYNHRNGIETAFQIGVAAKEQHGEDRFAYLIGKALHENHKERKNTVYELAGTFTQCNITNAQMLIEAAKFFIRTLKIYAMSKNEIQIAFVHFQNEPGTNLKCVSMTTMMEPHVPIILNLYSQH